MIQLSTNNREQHSDSSTELGNNPPNVKAPYPTVNTNETTLPGDDTNGNGMHENISYNMPIAMPATRIGAESITLSLRSATDYVNISDGENESESSYECTYEDVV